MKPAPHVLPEEPSSGLTYNRRLDTGLLIAPRGRSPSPAG
jgi:hypothetical protein